jgi:hypothetical protein
MIDIVEALDLLHSCVRECGEDYHPRQRRLSVVPPVGHDGALPAGVNGIVARALTKAGVPSTATAPLANSTFADVCAPASPPLNLTLGAVIAFRAAESAERRGQTWAMSLQAALQAASRFVELISRLIDSPAMSGGNVSDPARRVTGDGSG